MCAASPSSRRRTTLGRPLQPQDSHCNSHCHHAQQANQAANQAHEHVSTDSTPSWCRGWRGRWVAEPRSSGVGRLLLLLLLLLH